MAIGAMNCYGTNLGSLTQWASQDIGIVARRNRSKRQEVVQQRLTELLFGLELNIEEMSQYRARLLQALVGVDDVINEPAVPNISTARVGRSEQVFKTGGIGWRPFKITQRAVEVSGGQRLMEVSLARAIKLQHSLDPQSIGRPIHSVGIVVARGSEGVRQGEDLIELSSWGYEVMENRDFPKISQLRLPPRFPNQIDFMRLCAS